jgi:hypothetical protein
MTDPDPSMALFQARARLAADRWWNIGTNLNRLVEKFVLVTKSGGLTKAIV